jgi:hypothetical protein
MKRNYLLALGLVVVLTMLVLPASAARKMEHRANGKVTQYAAVQPPNTDPPSSMVVNGNWNLRVVDGKVDFQLSYKERNLISEDEGGAPVGSIDLFKITFIGEDQYHNPPFAIVDGAWVITGDFHISKLAAQPDGSKVWIYDFLGSQHGGAVHIYPGGGLALDVGFWHLMGSINSMK